MDEAGGFRRGSGVTLPKLSSDGYMKLEMIWTTEVPGRSRSSVESVQGMHEWALTIHCGEQAQSDLDRRSLRTLFYFQTYSCLGFHRNLRQIPTTPTFK